MCVLALVIKFSFLPLLLVAAHNMDHDDRVGCCGDIPETLIWTLSFFILFGILIAMGAFFLFPESPTCGYDTDTRINVRIDDRDIRKIARAVNDMEHGM